MQRGAAVASNTCAYFSTSGSAAVHCYHFNDNKWEELPTCPHTHFALVICDGILIAVGGMIRPHFTNKILSLQHNKWIEEYPSMNLALSDVAAVTVSDSQQNKFIITVGGCDAFGWSNVVQLFSLSTQTWYHFRTVMALPLTYPSAIVCGHSLYIVGDSSSGFSCSVNDLLSLSPQPCAPLPRLPVSCSTIATFSGHPVIVGGKQNGIPVNHIHKLAGDKWVKISSLSCGKYQCLVVSPSPNKMIIVGGVSIHFSLSSMDICSSVCQQWTSILSYFAKDSVVYGYYYHNDTCIVHHHTAIFIFLYAPLRKFLLSFKSITIFECKTCQNWEHL